MTNEFREIAPPEITDNVFKLIDQDWMLVTAGSPDHFNTMTASWGGLGSLWHELVSFVFVRPQRYTYQFMEAASHFTLTFFDEEHRDVLNYCGTHSGRDVDKIAQTGLTPVTGETGAVYFVEARLVLECKKLYAQDLTAENFVDMAVRREIYPTDDFHRVYVGQIVHCLQRA